MKLLLFDIDGTILRANGTGRVAIENALSELCQQPISTDAVMFSGKTDPQIMREILEANDLDPTPSLVDEALAVYEAVATEGVSPSDITLLPGVADLLERLDQRDDVTLGLLTGNIRPMAYQKLDAVKQGRYFPFGAFGSDHAERSQLPAIALERAHEHASHAFSGRDVAIIGDTPNDIQCGEGIGAFSVGVCTGHYDRSDLAPHEPNALLENLQSTEAFVQQVVDQLSDRAP